MLASLRFAVELPPVPASGSTGPVSLEPWWEMAHAAVGAGAGVVWFTGGPASGDDPPHDAADPGCDACTIAAAAVSRVDTALLGVVSAVPVGRHPAVLARDVTTLDVVSGGRAAVLLRWAGRGAAADVLAPAGASAPPGAPARARGGPSAVCAYLGEAVAVCRSVLQDDRPVFEGVYLHVAGAVNRPPPRRPGGPPLLVEVPAGAAGLARRGEVPGLLLHQLSSAAAIVCPDEPAEVASWQALLEEANAPGWTGADREELPAVVCCTTRHVAPARGDAAPARGDVAPARLAAARAAGAAGVVVRLSPVFPGDAASPLEGCDAARVVDELAACFEPWRR